MNRFYIETELNTGNTIELTESVFHHWVRVLRAKEQDQAIFFNGKGGEYIVTLTEINKKNAFVSIDQFNSIDRTATVKVILGQVMSKGDRMDYAIQKATELGVTTIQLLTSERCEMRLRYERDQKKLDHWQSIAIAACEQCGMNKVPNVLAPISLTDWVKSAQLPQSRFVLAPNKDQENVVLNSQPDLALLIGPEGGLSEAEIDAANQNHFQNWCIGDRVLRTETAPVVALSILNYHFSTK
ncbi:16S rRNA (uracil(1498)-N(3))-methyltransferase [Acinetobacter modestus]|uniref:16S rRNA (uracil(1498)-N(3))-methyltransferase n=1 Tax=Acinetobacter modestus TaxID=1776740 RepID=UPI001F4A2F7E|nr:16S rRNA (uracil(1498)-N(3))-methyltransferase [Acinetobacter modestus]MCH7330524.1 16S rRNA (uracil(1498)-N(3))-methyltransferase [Acinetobacter modestus]